MRFKLACVQYQPVHLKHWCEYQDRMDSVIGAAAGAGAGMVVLPEYAGMELASLLGPAQSGDLMASIEGIQARLSDFVDLHALLAHRYKLIVVAGSIPVPAETGWRNRVHVFGPEGLAGTQDKLVTTEPAQWGQSDGEAVTLFDAPFGRFAVAICSDVEFPQIVAAMAKAGARLVLVPSCTDTLAGFYRVRSCARARAVEYQMYVAQAPLVGAAPWSPAIEINVGKAGIFTPCDFGFPPDGLMAEGTAEITQIVVGALDFDLISQVRAESPALTYLHQIETAKRSFQIAEVQTDKPR